MSVAQPDDSPIAAPGAPRLSVLLPTVRAWPEVRDSLVSLLAQRCEEEFEILLLDGHGAALVDEPAFPVRWLRVPGSDVFALRALGLTEARGEIVAITEDHCVMPPDWCARTLAAHRASPALALVAPVTNHPDSARCAVDRANFLLTMGPFAPEVLEFPRERLPIPTNLSLKRAALPPGRAASGTLEYDFLAGLRNRGELALAPDPVFAHRQSWSRSEALRVHFHSGRAYGASSHAWRLTDRVRWFVVLPSMPWRIWRITRPALRSGAAGSAPVAADRAWLAALILANIAGQIVGAIAGAGSSHRRLV